MCVLFLPFVVLSSSWNEWMERVAESRVCVWLMSIVFVFPVEKGMYAQFSVLVDTAYVLQSWNYGRDGFGYDPSVVSFRVLLPLGFRCTAE